MKQDAAGATQAEIPSTRDRILDAAEARFAERGFAGAAVREIAAAAGLNAASLYNHFPGKEELYEAVLERGLRPVVELLDSLASGGQEADRYAPIDAVVAHFAGSPNLARLIQQDVLGGGERVVRIAGRLLGPIYEQGIAALRRSDGDQGWDDDELALLLLGFQNLILGYFALAPVSRLTLGHDPLEPEAVHRQAVFLRRVAARLMPG